jgi:hypothetical protein
MSKRAPFRCLVLAGLLCLPLHAAAGDEPFGRKGLYVAAGAAYGIESMERVSGAGLDISDSWGIDARVGYRIAPHAAVEINSQYYTDFNVNSKAGADVGSIDGYVLTANGKIYPATGRVQPYAVLGVGFSAFHGLGRDWSDVDPVLRLGGGVDLYIIKQLAAYVELSGSLPVSDDLVAPLLMGLQYRF